MRYTEFLPGCVSHPIIGLQWAAFRFLQPCVTPLFGQFDAHLNQYHTVMQDVPFYSQTFFYYKGLEDPQFWSLFECCSVTQHASQLVDRPVGLSLASQSPPLLPTTFTTNTVTSPGDQLSPLWQDSCRVPPTHSQQMLYILISVISPIVIAGSWRSWYTDWPFYLRVCKRKRLSVSRMDSSMCQPQKGGAWGQCTPNSIQM